MKKISILFALVFSLTNLSYSQMDFGFNLGGASYLGEIGGSEGEAKPWLLDMKLNQTNIAAGGFFRYDFSKTISAKLTVSFIRIEGADSLSNEPTRIGRNLSFRTDMIEIVATGEYNFFRMNDLSRRSKQRIDFASYGFIGAGILMYYPYAQYQDKWFALRPLQTEGEENAYSEMTVAIPMGAGAHFTFNKKIRLGMEIGYRFTFTDYLDDVSTDYAFPNELPFAESSIFANRSAEAYARGDISVEEVNPGHYGPGGIRGGKDSNDGYLVAQLSLSFVIGGNNSFYKSKYNSIINRRRKRTKF